MICDIHIITHDVQLSNECILQVITVQAVINNVNKTFTLNNLSSVSAADKLGRLGG